MGSFFFGGKSVGSDTVDDIQRLFKERTGDRPSIYQRHDTVLISSSDSIDQGSLKVAFNGYILDNEIEPERCIAEAYRKHGEEFINHLDGQFRLILYDEKKDRFYTSADKLGRKVVYYGNTEDIFVCSSHLAPLLRHPAIAAEPSLVGVSDFLQGWSASFGGGQRLIKDISRLYPSHYIVSDGKNTVEKQFWDTGHNKQSISDAKAVEKMDGLLREGAKKLVEQSTGDLNVFLSGGFDSTFLVSLLREVTDRNISTYTWGWEKEHFRAGREMADLYDTEHTEIRNSYNLPSNEEIYFYEEPQNAFVRYPFRELYKNHGLKSYWTGLNSQATFPVCLKNIRKLDRANFLSPIVRKLCTERVKQSISKADYKVAKGLEVLESKKRSTSAVIDWGARKQESRRLIADELQSRELDAALDDKWRIPKYSYQESYNYLQLRTRDTARYAYYSQDLEHYDIYGYRPLVEFSYSLPMSQKKNRRLLQKIADNRVPNRIITKGASGWEFVSKQFMKTIQSNEEEYRDTVMDFIQRGMVDERAAENQLLPDKIHRDSGRVNQMMSVYLLERWMKIFLDREEPWRPI